MSRIALCAAAAVVAALCAATATAGTASRAARRSNFPPTTFTDESNDSGTAADIQTITVTNDENGQYTIDVAFGTPYGDTDGTLIFLDTDANPSTGYQNGAGAEYVLVEDHKSRTYGFEKWDGSQFVDAASTSTLSLSVSTDNHLVFSFNKSEVDNSAEFHFFVVTIDGDGSAGHVDDAPSGTGTYDYKLQGGTSAPLTLSIAASTQSPAKAGGTWTVVLAAKRSDTGATLGSEGTIACRATGGGKRLAAAGKGFVTIGGLKAAVCRFHVGKKLKHKLLHATLTVSYQGASVTHSFTTHAK